MVAALLDGFGRPVSGVYLTVGLKDYVTNPTGQIAIPLCNLSAGNHTVMISFGGNENYTDSNIAVNVTVNKDGTRLDAVDVVTVYNSDDYLVATLLDGFNRSISGVNLAVGLKNYSTDALGKIKMPLNDLSAGEYGVLISFDGNENYTQSHIFVMVSVAKLSTSLTSSKITKSYGETKNLVVNLKDKNGKVLAGKRVSVVLNGVTYTKITDAKGQISIAVPKALAPKTYTAKISFDGDANYVQSAESVKVVITKAKSKIVAKKKTFKKAKKVKKYTITLKSGKNPIKKVKVTIKIKKKTYKAKTNKKGKATFKIKKLNKKGVFRATIKFKGNKYYKKVTKKVKIKIK